MRFVMGSTRWRAVTVATCCWVASLGVGGDQAEAACNLIPQTEKTFDGALGALNRPFAAPSEPVQVQLRPCDTASPGLPLSISNYLVTVIYTPEGIGAAKHAVVLTSGSCGAINLSPCTAQLGVGGSAMCVPAPASAMQLVNPSTLRFNFPDTDGMLAPAGDLRTLTGPAK